MVSIDGWVNIINSHPLLAGFELDAHYDSDKKLAAFTCKMHRKDRSLPIVVTEYMIECFRNTEPWRTMPNRMLRHKALIQAARYAFGLSGIYDEDEARDISGMKDITPVPTARPKLEDFVIPAKMTNEAPLAEEVNAETGEVTTAEEEAYSAADAWNDGNQAAADGKTLADLPKHVKALKMDEAWTDGFKSYEPEESEQK